MQVGSSQVWRKLVKQLRLACIREVTFRLPAPFSPFKFQFNCLYVIFYLYSFFIFQTRIILVFHATLYMFLHQRFKLSSDGVGKSSVMSLTSICSQIREKFDKYSQ